MNSKLVAALSSLTLLIAGCGGESSNDTTEQDSSGTILTGIFIDSKVANIGYKTETQSGVTNNHGEFRYVAGENVSFSIGNLDLPTAKAKGVITPMTLAAHPSIYHETATNIAMLLQSLDEDGIAENGIRIAEGAAEAAPAEINFNSDSASFSNNAAVINMVANSGAFKTELITASDAQAHMQTSIDTLTPHIGAWSSVNDNQASRLILLANNTFIYAENDAELPNGVEFGTYSYDASRSELTFDIQFDSNGPGEDSGVGDIGTPVTTDAHFSNNNSTLAIVGGAITLNADTFSSSMEGLWSFRQGTAVFHLALYSDNTFLIVQSKDNAPQGLQLGSYQYNSSTKEITLSRSFDDTEQGDSLGEGNELEDMMMALEVVNNHTLSLMNDGLILSRSL